MFMPETGFPTRDSQHGIPNTGLALEDDVAGKGGPRGMMDEPTTSLRGLVGEEALDIRCGIGHTPTLCTSVSTYLQVF
jgi:hypothetical protein